MRKDKVPNGEYRVKWEIDLPATSPKHAAELAKEIMIELSRKDNLATYFSVQSPDGSTTVIDLLKE